MKTILLIGLLIISFEAIATDKKLEALEKGMRESLIGKILKNKVGIDIVNNSKQMNQWAEKKESYTVKSKKRELNECMGKRKIISNETINCYYGQ